MTARYRAIDTIALHCQLACIWEATARKPGNVHRFKDFEDVSYLDFVASAAAIAPIFHWADNNPLGYLITRAIDATHLVAPTNTNLGMVLLLAPLAKATAAGNLRGDLEAVLANSTVGDAEEVYCAIRFVQPGGLGRAVSQDISTTPTQTLREVMALAADRDLVARQYANGFQEVLQDGVPAFQRGLENMGTLESAIIACHLHLLHLYPDSLIARKNGTALAAEASDRASQVLDAGWPHADAGRRALADFDAWLRADGHRRNPGTTADLVAASLFVALREGIITLPLSVPWSFHDGVAAHGP
jgi:triphosphoribosyl-dephospho-CoA synthase